MKNNGSKASPARPIPAVQRNVRSLQKRRINHAYRLAGVLDEFPGPQRFGSRILGEFL